jgi:hypothetical protein
MATTTPISVFGLLELPPVCPQNRPVSEQLFLIFGHAGIRCAGDPSQRRQAVRARAIPLHRNKFPPDGNK